MVTTQSVPAVHRRAARHERARTAPTDEEHTGAMHPALRANPFPEVTDPFCRLPLSTFFYRPEASNLGDLMRLMVRPGVQITTLPPLFMGSQERTGLPGSQEALPASQPYLQII